MGRTPRTRKTRVGTRLWQAPTCSLDASFRAWSQFGRSLSSAPPHAPPHYALTACLQPSSTSAHIYCLSLSFLVFLLFRPLVISKTISTPPVLLTSCL